MWKRSPTYQINLSLSRTQESCMYTQGYIFKTPEHLLNQKTQEQKNTLNSLPCTLSCGAPALELTGSGVGSTRATIWGLPTPGIKPSSPALQGGFLTTGPPRKSRGKSSFKIVSPGRPIALSALRV